MSRHEFPLKGHTFFIARMDAFSALGTLAELQKALVSPLLSGSDAKALRDGAAAANAGEEAGQGLALDAILAGLANLSSRLGKDETLRLVRMLLDPECISVILSGRTEPDKLRDQLVLQAGLTAPDLLALCTEVVKVNYEDFLGVLAPLISKANFLMAKPSGGSLKN